jgi:precorrin-6A/cobalt-precorrin-6A reductase
VFCAPVGKQERVMSKKKILLLGGTTEAREIAEVLATRPSFEAVMSLAGATTIPGQYALPLRIGGFGGSEGLALFLRENKVDLLVNATHPYANQMWLNAIQASRLAQVPLVVFHRPEWVPTEADRWSYARDIGSAVSKLKRMRARNIFLPLGRKELVKFEAVPKHRYLIRAIEVFDPPLKLPHVTYLKARPPFDKAAEIALMKRHRIDLMIVKNSGGSASYAKMVAARELGIDTIVVRRPYAPGVQHCRNVAETLAAIVEALGHDAKRVA